MGAALLLLLLLAVVRNSRALRKGAAAALVLLATLSTQAQADDREFWQPFYATATVSYADTKVSTQALERAFEAQGIASTVHSADGGRWGWGVGAGYRLADRWSIEAGYLDLGEVSMTFDALGTARNVARVHPSSGNGATLSGLYRLPLSERIGSYARLGMFTWRSKYEAREGGEIIDTYRKSSTDLLWGFGVSYAFSLACDIALELQRIEFEDEPTNSFGVRVRWGQ